MVDQQQHPPGGLGTDNTGTSAIASTPDQNNDTSAAGNTLRIGPSTSGGGTSALGGSGGASDAAGTPGTNVSGFTAPSTKSTFGGGSSSSGLLKPESTFRIRAARATHVAPPVTTGTSTPAYSVTRTNDMGDIRAAGTHLYMTITTMPAYSGQSLEELRLQDYQRNRKTGTLGFFGAVGQQRTAVSDPNKQALVEELVESRNLVFFAQTMRFSPKVRNTSCTLIDFTDDDDVPSNAWIDNYGYGSDSDLDGSDSDLDDDLILVGNPEAPKDQSAASLTSSPKASTKMGTDGSFSENKAASRSIASRETTIQTAKRLRSLSKIPHSRRQLPTSWFNIWWATCIFDNSLDEPRCSAKSMYRLASKIGLDNLRDEALAHIWSNLNEDNILKELSCSLVSKYPQLLEMELDAVLYSHITSRPVVINFAALARIAQKQLPHGADIIAGIHTRLSKEHHPMVLDLIGVPPLPELVRVEPDIIIRNVPHAGTQSASGANESSPSVPPHASTNKAVPTIILIEAPDE
ncbi:hypothetical protein OG21DRAFT_1527597 [Imleria badia]|nr:hypothetical protein OG21DRAFT_1527597 [Imleria badia]